MGSCSLDSAPPLRSLDGVIAGVRACGRAFPARASEGDVMASYLVVANQTLAGERLIEEIDARIEKEPSTFFVVAPATALKDYRGAKAADGSMGGDPMDVPPEVRAAREARRQAQQRLTRLLEHIRTSGATADGRVGDSDPGGRGAQRARRRQLRRGDPVHAPGGPVEVAAPGPPQQGRKDV